MLLLYNSSDFYSIKSLKQKNLAHNIYEQPTAPHGDARVNASILQTQKHSKHYFVMYNKIGAVLYGAASKRRISGCLPACDN